MGIIDAQPKLQDGGDVGHPSAKLYRRHALPRRDDTSSGPTTPHLVAHVKAISLRIPPNSFTLHQTTVFTTQSYEYPYALPPITLQRSQCIGFREV